MKRNYFIIIGKLSMLLFTAFLINVFLVQPRTARAVDNTDVTPPVIQSVSIDKAGKSVKAGNTVHLSVKVTDDKSGVKSVSFALRSYNSPAINFIDLIFDSTTGEYKGNFNVTEYTAAGIWGLYSIDVSDNSNNHTYYSYESLSAPFDISVLKFVVLANGTTEIKPLGILLGNTSVILTKTGATAIVPVAILPDDAVNKTIIWSSGNNSVATVTGCAISGSTVSGGAITAVGNGRTTITATTADGGFSASCDVIISFITGIKLDKEKIVVANIYQDSLTAIVTPSEALSSALVWESSNPDIVTVDQSGHYRGIKNGKAVITAKTPDGLYKATCEVTVNIPSEFKFYEQNIVLTEIGESKVLGVTLLPDNLSIKTLEWSSNAPSIATVDNTGKVTAITNGLAYITAKIAGSSNGITCLVTVHADIPVTGITFTNINTDPIILNKAGKIFIMTYKLLPNGTTYNKIKVSSSDSKVAEAVLYNSQPYGAIQVTPISDGITTITLSTQDGSISCSCNIMVKTLSSISLNKDTVTFTKALSGEKLQVTSDKGEVLPSGMLVWSSSNPSVLHISNDTGIIIPANNGTTTIKVSTWDGSFSDTCTVTVNIPTKVDNTDITAPVIISAKIDEAGKSVKAGDIIHIRLKVTDDKSDITQLAIDFVNKTVNINRPIMSNNNGFYYDQSTDEYVGSLTIDAKMTAGLWYCDDLLANDQMSNQCRYKPYRYFSALDHQNPGDSNFYTKDDLRFVVLANGSTSTGDAVQAVEIREENNINKRPDYVIYKFTVKGQTITLHADVLPITALNKNVVWSSSNSNIAAVDAYGTVKAISNGTAVITVTTADGGFSSKCAVNVSLPADSESTSQGSAPFPSGTVIIPGTDDTTTTKTTKTEGNTVITTEATRQKRDDGTVELKEDKTVTDSDTGILLNTISKTRENTEGETISKEIASTVSFTKPAVQILPNNTSGAASGNGNLAVIRLELPTSLLLSELKELPKDAKFKVKTNALTKTVEEQLKLKGNSDVRVEFIIDSQLTKNPAFKMSDILLEQEALEAAREYGKSITVSVKNEAGSESYSWTFDGNSLEKCRKELTDMNMALELSEISKNEEINQIFGKQGKQSGLLLSPKSFGSLPTQAEVKVFVGKQKGLKAGSKAYIYKVDSETGRLKAIAGGHNYVIDKNGYLTLKLLENADYVILPNKVDNEIVDSLRDQITVKKHISLNKGEKDRIYVKLPESLELVESNLQSASLDAKGTVTISYESNNEKVVKVNPVTGIITAIKPGKAIIHIKAALYSGKVKTIDTEIEVLATK